MTPGVRANNMSPGIRLNNTNNFFYKRKPEIEQKQSTQKTRINLFSIKSKKKENRTKSIKNQRVNRTTLKDRSSKRPSNADTIWNHTIQVLIL